MADPPTSGRSERGSAVDALSFGPPSVPHVPPPSLEQMVLRTRLRLRERERTGGRIANFGAVLYLVSLPVAMNAIRASYEASVGEPIDWPVFFNNLIDSGLAPLVGALLGVEMFLLFWTFGAGYFLTLDRPGAAYALVAGGVFAIVFHIVYLPYAEAVVGILGGALSILGGVFAIARPLPGEPRHV